MRLWIQPGEISEIMIGIAVDSAFKSEIGVARSCTGKQLTKAESKQSLREVSAGCGHGVCAACMAGHLRAGLERGGGAGAATALDLRCPAWQCPARVGLELAEASS